MNILKLTSLLALTALTGCATMFNGATDTINVDAGDGAVCAIGDVKFKGAVVVPRSYDDVEIVCESDQGSGTITVESDLQEHMLGVNFLLDFCIMSCPMDMASGALYDYPDTVVVPMMDKGEEK